jgi:UDP-4-amino-4,6-dideoxy-N-acetyl-beta-L-altrosamine transaminase
MNIPYGKQDINQDDIDTVVSILTSDFLTQGPQVTLFEDVLKIKCDSKYAVATNSATSALHIACLALDFKKDDILWTSPISFVASSNCALYCGGKVDFVDIDPSTFNMCANELEKKLEHAALNNCLPKIVVPVHLCGNSCDMEKIYELSIKYQFKIIEDASHAVGGSYKGFKIGSSKYSDITIFSFHPVKIITSGEGGMALTNNKILASKMSLLRTHGITRSSSEMDKTEEGSWYYEQQSLGYNYRITDIQAALGASQAKRLDEFVSKRNEISKRYINRLSNLDLNFQYVSKDSYSAYHLFVISLKNKDDIYNKKKIFESLRSHGIGVNLHYIPIYHHPFYKKMGFNKADFTNSENYYKSAISIPLFPGLSIESQDFVVKKIYEALQKK